MIPLCLLVLLVPVLAKPDPKDLHLHLHGLDNVGGSGRTEFDIKDGKAIMRKPSGSGHVANRQLAGLFSGGGMGTNIVGGAQQARGGGIGMNTGMNPGMGTNLFMGMNPGAFGGGMGGFQGLQGGQGTGGGTNIVGGAQKCNGGSCNQNNIGKKK